MDLRCSGLGRDVFHEMEAVAIGDGGVAVFAERRSGGPDVGSTAQPCGACGVRLRGERIECVSCRVRRHGCCTGVSTWRKRAICCWRCVACGGTNERCIQE